MPVGDEWATKVCSGGTVSYTHLDVYKRQQHGFLLNGGTYTAIDYPNAVYTTANGINDAGQIVGRRDDAAGKVHGFYAVKR